MKTLQDFDFRSSAYERPTQKWVCGHLASGKPCRIGPDGFGRCRATFECDPVKSGDTYVCQRPSSAGGPCAGGPLPDGTCCNPIPPCTPRLSVGAKRARVVKWLAVVAIGFVGILVAFAGSAHFLSPGPMTTAHSALSNCGVCHANVADGKFGWLHAIFADADAKQNSSACLKCHNMADSALSPHGLAMEDLEARTTRAREMWAATSAPISLQLRDAVFSTEEIARNEIYCASCHKEHRGERFHITEISDDQCQSCHVAQFASFQNGHPEPKDSTYPFKRRARIKFDHVRHFDQHFPEAATSKTNPKEAPGACGDCHVPGPGARQMVVLPFEQTCASCHLGQITGEESAEVSKGIALLALPGLDLESLRAKGAAIGYWPDEPYYLGTRLTPLLKLFIGADAEGRQLLDDLKALNLTQLEEATETQVRLVEDLVWKIKALVHTVSAGKISDSELVKRFTRQFDIEAADPQLLTQLTASVPRDVWIGFKNQWLPNLDDEMKLRQEGKSVPMPEPEKPASDTTQPPKEEASANTENGDANGEILPGADSKTPGSDDILSGNETDTTGAGDILPGNETDKTDDGDILSGAGTDTTDNGDILSGNETDTTDGGDILSGNETDTTDGGDILSGNETDTTDGGDILSGNEADTTDGGDILGGDTETGEVEIGPGGDEQENTADNQAGAVLSNQDWAEFGGWYRQDYEIRYKPATHADAFMRSWYNFTALLLTMPQKELAGDVFRQLSAKGAPGQCTKCHSVDATDVGGLEVNWSPASLDNAMATFTRFSHAPHFSIKDRRGCLTCHALDREVDTRKWYFEQEADAFGENRLPVKGKFDPTAFQSNFKPIQQKFCRSCHNASASGEDCQLCHVYHVGIVDTQHMARTTRITDDRKTEHSADQPMGAD